MKAKLPPGELRHAGDYLCQKCETNFTYEMGPLSCPNCGNVKPEDLIPVYMEDDSEEDEMYSADDWGQGD